MRCDAPGSRRAQRPQQGRQCQHLSAPVGVKTKRVNSSD
jgi:hypothetical protein